MNVFRIIFITALVFILCTPTVYSAEFDPNEDGLTELSLERLLEITVVSASRKSQSLADVTSAVFVITQEDIRRSGATTIPDLLRMVPGVQVASIDGNSWAISIRGFNGTFANKLLVMIDGRSVYTPLYGGVFWDVQDSLLENIERIEVIRGSGGTMWGANAVNGVINIITKNSQDTKGTFFSGLAGSNEKGTVGARYGSDIGENTSYRLFAKHVDRDSTYMTTGRAQDSTRLTRGGFRLDNAASSSLQLTLQGDMYGGTVGNTATIPTLSYPFSKTVNPSTDLLGGNFLSRLDWLQSESSKFSLQLYYDRTRRDTTFVKEDRDTVDIDLQHNLHFAKRHELTWGVGYRFLHDNTAGTQGVFTLTPDSRSDNLLNLFLQDEITLLPETIRLIIGTKFEHNDYTGWELQPSARVSWTPVRGYSVWAAVTRSVRTPTRSDQDVRINLAVIPPTPEIPLPSVPVMIGNRQLKSETLIAYELGFRADTSQNTSMDFSLFYNRYRNIMGSEQGIPYIEGGTQLTIPINYINLHNYQSGGGEMSLQWQPLEWWKLKGGYAYIRFYGSEVEDSRLSTGTPAHQATIRSMCSLGRDVDFDLWVRYVGNNRYPLITETVHIPAYTTMDARVAWRPADGVELSLIGQNLLEKRHIETVSDFTVMRHEVERSVYGKVAWTF